MTFPRRAFRWPPIRQMYAGRARMMLTRSWLVYRRMWWEIASGFAEPVCYLMIMGVGVGALGNWPSDPATGQAGYMTFIAPGLLAAATMTGAIYDTTMSVFFKFRHARLYDAALTSPLGPFDIALGELVWASLRGMSYAGCFLLVMALQGMVHSASALLVVPAAFVVAFAFGALGLTATTFMKSWQDAQFVQLAIVTSLMLSGVFYPTRLLPDAIAFTAELLPLSHAVQLMRALVSGAVSFEQLTNLLYFAGIAFAGLIFVAVRLRRTLVI